MKVIRDSEGRPDHGHCDVCGSEVDLSHFCDVMCSCGAWYNASGQRLTSPDQWLEGDDLYWPEQF